MGNAKIEDRTSMNELKVRYESYIKIGQLFAHMKHSYEWEEDNRYWGWRW